MILKLWDKKYAFLYTLLKLKVCCQYDGPKNQNLGHLNWKTRNEKNNTKSLFVKTKVKTLFDIRFID